MKSKMQPDDINKIKKAFTTPIGEKALEVLNRVFYNTISFHIGDPHKTSFNEGHRDVVQFINNCVGFDSEPKDSTKGDSK